MDKLVSVDAIKTRIGQDPQIDNDDFIGSAILAAQKRIESILGTPLAKKVDNVDRFYLNPQDNSFMQRNGLFRCRLRRGFVTTLTSVFYAGVWNATSSEWQALPTTDESGRQTYLFDADSMETGIFQVDSRYGGNHLKISYLSGFDATNATSIPDWLAEAIMSLAPAMFATLSPTNRNTEAVAEYQALEAHALDVLQSHMRSKSLILRPL